MSLLIHKTGLLASIQDGGRYGYQHWGIPVGGAMDIDSMHAANLLCDNDSNEAVIECTLHGASIEFQQSHQFTMTGGGATATLNNKPMPFNQLISTASGDLLQLYPSPNGCRSYLAVAGGFAIEAELNSRSTYPLAQLGGINGHYLKAGDTVPVREQKIETKYPAFTNNHNEIDRFGDEASGRTLLQRAIDNPALLQQQITIRCHPGPEWDWFKDQAQQNFLQHLWMIGPHSNRMGYSLIGPALQKNNTQELISTPVTFGIVQVTSAGQPIVLMADSQTIGGYPRIARIAASDLPVLGQCRPGMSIYFQLS